MNKNELMNLYEDCKNLFDLNEYLIFMRKNYPLYIDIPNFKTIQNMNLSEEQEDELYMLITDEVDYSNPLKNNISLDNLLWSKIYSYKKLSVREYIRFQYFRKLLSTYRRINYAIKNPIYLEQYTDTETIYYENEDLIITDPCYIDETYEKYTDYLMHDTLYGDWICEIISNNKRLGTFMADSGYVSVFKLKEIEKKDFLNKNFLYTIIHNFTGNVTIKVKYIDDFICYVEGNGNINFISQFIGY